MIALAFAYQPFSLKDDFLPAALLLVKLKPSVHTPPLTQASACCQLLALSLPAVAVPEAPVDDLDDLASLSDL